MNLSLSRRQFLKTATFAAGALLAGCGPRGVPGARVTLTQWYHQYGEPGTQQAVLRYAREYTKLHPDVAVRVVWIPGDYSTKLGTALLTRNGPDVFESTLNLPMVTAGEVAPLDDLFTPEIRADFNPKDLALNSVGGKVYGVKMFDDTAALYYRKSILEKSGVAPPQTMDELIAAVKILNKSDRKALFLGNDGGVGALITIAPWSAGVDFLVDGRITFNTPRAALAYEKVLELNATNALLLGAPTDWYDPSAFTQGLAAMQWTGLWAYPAIRKALGDDVGVLPWPALDSQGTPATFLGGWTAMVNAQSDNIDEAKKYVKWLWIDRVDLQKDWCLSYGFHVPTRKSVAQTADALRTPAAAAIAHNLSVYGRALPPEWNSAMNTALTDAATHILKEGRPAAESLAVAARKCEIVLRRMQE